MRRADHSSRGVLPTVVRRCVCSRNLVNEEALAHCGLSRQKQTNKHNGISAIRLVIASQTFIHSVQEFEA